MEQTSDLEKFLSQSRESGQVMEEGNFTLAREKALQKIASYQLPFEGAWALKLIQAAVASSGGTSIKVELTRKEAHFFFQSSDWTAELIEEAFYNPESQEQVSLDHLCSGLWGVGLKLKHPFQLSLPGEEDTLVWDGQDLHRVQLESKFDCCYLAVAMRAYDGSFAWLKDMTLAAKRNAELLDVLSRHCYTCPLPLTLDGRRVDSLYNSPSHGISGMEQLPLTASFPQEGQIPTLAVPPGTFQGVKEEDLTNLLNTPITLAGGGLRSASRKARQSLHPVARSTAPFLLTAHFKKDPKGSKEMTIPRRELSLLHWVKDGVIVETEYACDSPSYRSVAVFVNASDLASDASGFALRHSKAKLSRATGARRIVADTLRQMPELKSVIESYVKAGTKGTRVFSGGAFLFGLACFPLSYFIGGATLLASLYGMVMSGGAQRKEAQELQDELNYLAGRIEATEGSLSVSTPGSSSHSKPLFTPRDS